MNSVLTKAALYVLWPFCRKPVTAGENAYKFELYQITPLNLQADMVFTLQLPSAANEGMDSSH